MGVGDVESATLNELQGSFSLRQDWWVLQWYLACTKEAQDRRVQQCSYCHPDTACTLHTSPSPKRELCILFARRLTLDSVAWVSKWSACSCNKGSALRVLPCQEPVKNILAWLPMNLCFCSTACKAYGILLAVGVAPLLLGGKVAIETRALHTGSRTGDVL